MKENLISFETAKLAKEKGCDISAFSNRIIFNNGYTCDKCHSHLYKKEEIYPVCTQSLLQKWLRVVHKISVEVSSCQGYLVGVYTARDGYHIDDKWNDDMSIKTFNSFEDALEVGLVKALELIEDDKHKS